MLGVVYMVLALKYPHTLNGLSDLLRITIPVVIRPYLFLPHVFRCNWALYNDSLSNMSNNCVLRLKFLRITIIKRFTIKPEVRKINKEKQSRWKQDFMKLKFLIWLNDTWFLLDHFASLKNDYCLVNQYKMVKLMLKHHVYLN